MKNLSWILMWSIVILTGCSGGDTSVLEQTPKYETYQIISWNIEQEQTFVGHVEPYTHTTVSAKIGWRVNFLAKDKWDTVRWGETLVKLDGAELQVNYNSADSMQSALINLKQETSDMFDAQILAMQEQVNQSKKALDMASVGLNDSHNSYDLSLGGKKIQQTQLMAETVQVELAHTKSVLAQQEQNIYSNAKNTLSQSKTLLWDIGVFVDTLLGISDKHRVKNDRIESFIWAKNILQKQATHTLWVQLNKERTTLSSSIASSQNISTDLSLEDKALIYKTLQATEQFLNKVKTLLDEIYVMLDNSSTSQEFTQTHVDQYKKATLDYKASLEQTLVRWSLQTLDNFREQSQMQITLLTKKGELAQSQFEVAKESISSQYEIVQSQYQQALAGLQALKKQKETQLAQITTQITQTQGNKSMASVQLGNTQVVAPFGGVIIERLANLWQVIGPGTPLFALGKLSVLKVQVSIPESFITKITQWQAIHVTLPSLKKELEWSIDVISPMADVMSKKIPVEIKINNADLSIKFGMYAEVSFGSQRQFGLKIPLNFLRYSFGEAYVLKKDKKVFVEKLWCEEQYCIVVSDWLKEGDIIVK